MAVPPPYDRLTVLPGKAVNKLTSALNKLINYLKKLVNRLREKASLISSNTKCNDPRITELKQLLEKIKSVIDRVRNVLLVATTIITVLRISITIASTSLNASLLIPVPTPPAAAQVVNVLNTLITNIISVVKQLSITLPIITLAVAGISFALGPVINLIGSVCTNETFSVDSDTIESIVDDLEIKLKDIIQQYPSKFYQTVNVSEQDIDQRNRLIEELISRNQDVLTNLLEAPSKVILGSTTPNPSAGKIGDYFIDEVNQLIYGPKQNDLIWGTGVNY